MNRVEIRSTVDLSSLKNDKVISTSKKSSREVNLADLPADPRIRSPISCYHPYYQDQVRRTYLQKGPCQLHHHAFPYRGCGQEKRQFNPSWFKDDGSWL